MIKQIFERYKVVVSLWIFFFILPLNGIAAIKFFELPFSSYYNVLQGWIYTNGNIHKGIDYDTPTNTSIQAAYSGVARQYYQCNTSTNYGYGNYVYISHGNGYYSLYGHLSSANSNIPYTNSTDEGSWVSLTKGEEVGKSGVTCTDYRHLHFEVETGPYPNGEVDPYDLYTTESYYPPDGINFNGCGSEYLWTSCPPVTVNYSTPSTSWNFNSSIEGWSAVNATDYGIDSGSFWKFNPGIDPQLISPQLSAVNASTHKILKIRMDVPGTGSDTGKVYFKNNINDSWDESKSVSFDINKSDSGQQVYYVQMRDAPNNSWMGQIAQIRIDPVVNYPTDNTGSTYLDYVTFESATDANTFVSQSDYPTVIAGQSFSVNFTIQNTGNTKWDSNYSLKLDPGIQNNNALGASNPTLVYGTVLPGLGTDSNYTFNLNMTAPLTTGVYRTGWRMTNPSGTFFGASMFVDVTVKRFPVERADFDGDGKSDIAVYRPSDGYWHILWSSIAGGDPAQSGVIHSTQWGIAGDVPVPGDYDGDGKTDIAIYRLNDPWLGNQTYWHIKRSSDGGTTSVQWGLSQTGDIPVPGDYDGDGKTDAAIFRYSDPYNNNQTYWHIKRSSDGVTQSVQWGLQAQGDIPAHGDFDGDGKTDVAVYRPTDGYWHILWSSIAGGDPAQSGVIHSTQWGIAGDVPLPGNFDGDTKSDVAIYRPSDGYWHVLWSSVAGGDPSQPGVIHSTQWGLSGDVPVPGKYDEDMKTDVAIYRPSTGYWHIIKSATGQISSVLWGLSTDVPIYDGHR